VDINSGSVGHSFKNAGACPSAEGMASPDAPVLLKRNGIDQDVLRLVPKKTSELAQDEQILYKL
jgi:hypothetical protein